jgi:iron complex outermembrane receptor protein
MRKIGIREVLLAGCATSFLMSGTAASAAESAGAAPNSIDEVVVTARRVDERLLEVPISITVVNQAEIDKRNITSPSQLGTFVPSLSVDRRFGGDAATFSIRGFFQEQGSTPTVGIYFADVVAPRGSTVGQSPSGDGATPGALFDLQNVQVLKGPQGTLFGRNTTGGLVLFVPQRPTSALEGYVEGSGGNFGMARGQAVVNVPVNDSVRLRFGVDRMTRDGYQDNIAPNEPRHFADVDYLALRASALVDLTSNLENYTIASFSRSDTAGDMNRILACNGPGQLNALFSLLGPLCTNQLTRENAAGFYSVDNGYQGKAERSSRQWQIINTTTWDVSSNFKIKNIASYAEFRSRYRALYFGDNFTLDPAQAAPFLSPLVSLVSGLPFVMSSVEPAGDAYQADQRTLTDELQFQGEAFNNRLNWQSGIYIEQSSPIAPAVGMSQSFIACPNAAALQCVDVLPFAPIGQGVTHNSTQVWYKNYGLYGQATYAVTDKLKATAGLRYTWDSMQGESHLFAYSFPTPFSAVATCVLPDAIGSASDTVNGCRTTQSSYTHKPTWMFDLEYVPNTDLMVYAKYSRGYRQGGISLRSVVPSYGAESIDAYEIGTKMSVNGPQVHGNLSLAGFYNKLSNQQLQASFLTAIPGGAFQQGILNIGASRTAGVELDSTLKFFDVFRLDVSGAYIDSAITQVGGFDAIVSQIPANLRPFILADLTGVREGQPLPFVPKFRAVITGSVDLPIPADMGSATLSMTFAHTSKTYNNDTDGFQFDGVPPDYIVPMNITNLNFDWRNVASKPIDFSIFVTNLFDNHYITSISGGWSSLGFEAGKPNEPRMYGVRLRYHFGG